MAIIVFGNDDDDDDDLINCGLLWEFFFYVFNDKGIYERSGTALNAISRLFRHKCFEIKERKGFKFCLVPTGSIRVEKYEDARMAMS